MSCETGRGGIITLSDALDEEGEAEAAADAEGGEASPVSRRAPLRSRRLFGPNG
jgi:hypothetical protein